MEETDYWDIAQQHQQKFEFYMVALVFTVLALSIQTANENGTFLNSVLEISAWACFLLSGLAALSKLEWYSISFFLFHYREIDESGAKRLREAKARGDEYVMILGTENKDPIDEYIQRKDESIEKKNRDIERVNKRGTLKYRIHKYAFVLGLMLLFVSRGSNLLAPYIYETNC